jgi:methylglutaconyl-CoA hydratase
VLAWLPRVVGPREAFWLTATGETITAARAVELGLVNATAASVEELGKQSDERAAALGRRSPRVHADIKDMIRMFAEVGDDAALDVSLDRLVVGSLRRGEG